GVAGGKPGDLRGTFVLQKGYDLSLEPSVDWDIASYTDELLTHSCANYVSDGSTVFTRDGKLVLRVSSICEGNRNCLNSGRIMSKEAFTHGLFAFKARVPKCHDVWPAIWLLPGDASGDGQYGRWPCSGEIDVVETVGDHDFGTFNVVTGSGGVHQGCDAGLQCNRCQPNYCVRSSLENSSSGGYFVEHVDCKAGVEQPSWKEHTFVLHWQHDKMTAWVDPIFERDARGRILSIQAKELPADAAGDLPTWKTYDRNTTQAWRAAQPFMEQCHPDSSADAPFDAPFKLVLNIAIGGYDGSLCRWGDGCSTACAGAVGAELVVSEISIWQQAQ
ncbi:unnamed protein product, partial [Polarella glacialis]